MKRSLITQETYDTGGGQTEATPIQFKQEASCPKNWGLGVRIKTACHFLTEHHAMKSYWGVEV
jgi:hypothetical protein